jgi:methylated-DNA-[protein]-cysteine S-methyltransferase
MSNNNDIESEFSAWLGDQQSETKNDDVTDKLDLLYGAGPDALRVSEAQALVHKAIAEIRTKSIFYDGLKDSPVGQIFIAVDDQGVVAIKIDLSESEFISQLEQKYKTAIIRSPDKTADAIAQLQDYFDGKRSSFSLNINFKDLTQFQQKVLRATLEIPHGEITTYGEIARRLGKVRLARAVGQALARNPIPIVIPCHRVLSADGSLHGYSGGKGLETKGQLLQLEGALQG